MADVDERVTLTCLADFYGPLLTPHRREVIRLYCEEDLSLGEIAEQLGITRQGVFDAMNKGRRQLETYEEKLGLIERYRRIGLRAQDCMDVLEDMQAGNEAAPRLDEAKQALRDILNER